MTRPFAGYWGSGALLYDLRCLFVHRVLPVDVTQQDMLFWARKTDTNRDTWQPERVIYIGSGEATPPFDPQRLLVTYGADRKILDISIG